MSQSTHHLQAHRRSIHRAGIVTIGRVRGQFLVCMHSGKWRGKPYPARVVLAARGPASALVARAESVPVIPSSVDDRREKQEQAIREAYSDLEVTHKPEDALTACYFWDM